jgi:predicted metal-binding membrane protein
LAGSASIVRVASRWLHAGRLVLSAGAAPALCTVSFVGWCVVLWPRAKPHLHAPAGASPLSLASWLAMLLAMMAPLLVQPIDHIWTRSFKKVRWRRVGLFALAYALVWTTGGGLLASAATYLAGLVPVGYSAVAAVALAMAWQTTAAKQICLNRCHALPTLPAFGHAADREAITFGLRSGCWCFGSCWALMLVPMCVGGAHVVAMAVTTAVAVGERYAACRPARGRLSFTRTSR